MKFKFKVRERRKSTSIKTKLGLISISLVVIPCLLLGIIANLLNYNTANSILSDTVVETTKQASQNISQQIINLKNAAIQTGIMKEISDPNVSVEEKQKIIHEQEALYGVSLGQIIDANGTDLFSGNDYSDRDYFKISMAGEAYMSSPVISKVTGNTVLVVSAPIWKDGIRGSEIVGIVTFDPDPEFLNNIVKSIEVSKNSYAYLINKEGTTIAHKDSSLIGVENSIKEATTDVSQKGFAEADQKMISGETGYSDIKSGGQNWILGYSPVEDTDGWGIGIMTYKSDFLGQMYTSIAITAAVIIIFILIAFFVAKKLAENIGIPLNDCSERLKNLAEGDLNLETIIIDQDNEIGLVANATTKIVSDFREMVNALTHILTDISNGNLDINLDDERLTNLFVKDFEPMLIALNRIVDNLNDTLSQINVASNQVASGSDQVAEGAQLLSQGATEQASSIEELLATINEVSQRVNETAENAVMAKEISTASSIATDKGKEQMQEMIVAMDEISKTSNEISNIIKNIDDIAFQTNILALNAAVEAARAGEAGKGFAVVADEVRNLAAKSAQSAKDTAELIEKALAAVENGTMIVSETAKSLDDVVTGAYKSAKVIQEIADASNEQAQHIGQVNIGVEQISSVVQNNSATAEESAAASEELYGQSQMLKALIEKFNLKDETVDAID